MPHMTAGTCGGDDVWGGDVRRRAYSPAGATTTHYGSALRQAGHAPAGAVHPGQQGTAGRRRGRAGRRHGAPGGDGSLKVSGVRITPPRGDPPRPSKGRTDRANHRMPCTSGIPYARPYAASRRHADAGMSDRYKKKAVKKRWTGTRENTRNGSRVPAGCGIPPFASGPAVLARRAPSPGVSARFSGPAFSHPVRDASRIRGSSTACGRACGRACGHHMRDGVWGVGAAGDRHAQRRQHAARIQEGVAGMLFNRQRKNPDD